MRFFSQRSLRRKPSAIREVNRLMTPQHISLGGGNPNPTLFPISKLTIELKTGESLEIPADLLEKGLQYSDSYGLNSLTEHLSSFMLKFHPNYGLRSDPKSWKICVTTGSQDALSKTFDCLLNPEDILLVEDPTYSGALAALQPIAPKFVTVPVDKYGINTDSLYASLKQLREDGKSPKALYTIPTGQNPSGCTLSTERKKSIYQMASEFDFLIIEDDPYYFLRFDNDEVQSFFDMDSEGRVIRFDSLSKILSSGIRMGWISGPSEILERVQFDQQATCLHASGISQVIAYSILNNWGEDGWNRHVQRVQNFYRERRNMLISLLEKYLSDVAVWDAPVAGMFCWIQFPNVEDTFPLMQHLAKEHKVLMVHGQAFSAKGEKSNCVRVSYSTVTEPDCEEAIKRLSKVLHNPSF